MTKYKKCDHGLNHKSCWKCKALGWWRLGLLEVQDGAIWTAWPVSWDEPQLMADRSFYRRRPATKARRSEITKPGKQKWTVILLYPDYIADDFGSETYINWATCEDPRLAVEQVQRKAAAANKIETKSPQDFKCIAVFPGHLTCELDASNF